MDGPRLESQWGEIFRTRPDWPWGPHSLLYNGYRVSFPGVKRPGRGVNHPPPSSAEVKERVELYLCFPSWPSLQFIRRTLPFYLVTDVWLLIYQHYGLPTPFKPTDRSLRLASGRRSTASLIIFVFYKFQYVSAETWRRRGTLYHIHPRTGRCTSSEYSRNSLHKIPVIRS